MPDPCETCQQCIDCPWCPGCDPHYPPGGGGAFLPDNEKKKTPEVGDVGQFCPWEWHAFSAAQVVNVNEDGTVNIFVRHDNSGGWVERNIKAVDNKGWKTYIEHREEYLEERKIAMSRARARWEEAGHSLDAIPQPVFYTDPTDPDGPGLHLAAAPIAIYATPVWRNTDGTFNYRGYFSDQDSSNIFVNVPKITAYYEFDVWKTFRDQWAAILTDEMAQAKKRYSEKYPY